MRGIDEKRIEMQKFVGNSFSLSYLPCAVLCDFLTDAGYEVVNKPDISKKTFSWFEAGDFNETCPLVTPSSRILRLCSEEYALSYLKLNSQSYVLIVSQSNTISPCLEPFKSRILQVRQEDEGKSAVSLIEWLFMQSIVWESRMQAVIDKDASIVSLLDIGALVLEGFTCILDDEGVMVSQCTYYEAPFEDSRSLSDLMGALLGNCPSNRQSETNETFDIRLLEWGGVRYLLVPLSINDIRVGFLLLHIGDCDPAYGLTMMMRHVSQTIVKLIVQQQGSSFGRYMSKNYYLSALLQGVQLEKESLRSCRNELGFPAHAQFKVIALDVHDCPRIPKEDLIVHFSKFNNGKNHCLFYRNHLVSILYAEMEEGTLLSDLQIICEANTHIYRPFQLRCAISQVFTNMEDICQGFRQTLYALEHRDLLLKEYLIADGARECVCLAFDAALPYFILGEAEKKNEMVGFFMNGTVGVPKILAQECMESATIDFALLWRYLSNDGNASRVGRLMFMHRNSVLYHIKQLEKRFALSLDDRLTRERMTMEFRVLFRQFDEAKLKRLFDVQEQEER